MSLGAKLGRNLRGGELVELISDLGGGKTTLVRGLARGAGAKDGVASPTFTISRVYQSLIGKIYHYDFYRLNEAGIMADELAESLDDLAAVTVIEWSDIVKNRLPKDRLRVRISVTGENARRFELSAGVRHQHLLRNLS